MVVSDIAKKMAQAIYGAPTPAATAQAAQPKKPVVIKEGSSDAKLLQLLARANGQLTVDEMAALIPRARKRADATSPTVDAKSLKVQISKVLNVLKRKGGKFAERAAAITPKGFATQARGGEELADDDLAGLLDVDESDMLEIDEGDEGDATESK